MIRVGRGRLELQHGHLPLGAGLQPLSLLLGQAGGVAGQPGQLFCECGGSHLGFLTGAEGALQIPLRRLEPRHYLCFLHLTVHPRVTRRLLLSFQVGQP